MMYKIVFLDNDGNQLHGYIEAVSPYWARLQFDNEYDFEITDISEFHGILDGDALML